MAFFETMVSKLKDLVDVNISSPTAGQTLVYDATNDEWDNANNGLADAGDVAISSPTAGQLLMYDSTSGKWKNSNVPTEEKTATPSSSSQEITPTSGKYLSKVTVNAVATETKTATPTTSSQDITPSSGKFLSKVTVNAISTQTKTTTPTTRSATAATVTPDSGKYLSSVTVNTNSVPNNNTDTYTFPSGDTGGTRELTGGVTNTIWKVNATNVYNKGKADGALPSPTYEIAMATSSGIIFNASGTQKSQGDHIAGTYIALDFASNPNRWEYKAKVTGKYTVIKVESGTGVVIEQKTVSANSLITTCAFSLVSMVYI